MWIKFEINRLIVVFIVWELLCIIPCIYTRENLTNSMISIENNLIESRDSRALKRVFVSNRTITCNDGSQAGFYLRKSATSLKRWVVFLEGGWHCYDQKTCRARWLRLRNLMTSALWPETRNIGGILSPLQSENPYWHDANHVFIPYCSSDSWSGTKINPETRGGWRFMGSLIIKQVISDLVPLGLGQTEGAELILAGSSAGGVGVMLNLDKIKKYLLNVKRVKVKVRGISDSGWFLDREPFITSAVAASESVRTGCKFWQAELPEACVAQHSKEPWRCFFGHRLYATLKAPLFVFQWLFDEAQMRADSVGAPVTPQQWNYIHEMGGALRESLNNVTGVFAPSCIGHSVLTKREWLYIKIDNISLADALRCWERSGRFKRQSFKRNANSVEQDNNNNRKQKRRGKKQQEKHRKQKEQKDKEGNRRGKKRKELMAMSVSSEQPDENKIDNFTINLLSYLQNTTHTQTSLEQEVEIQQQSTRKPGARNRRLGGHKKNNQNQFFYNDTKKHMNKQLNNNNNNNSNSNKINKKNNLNKQQPHRHRSFREPKSCALRLMERCSWPQCNYSCPALTNPLTGEEMRFLELLASFGLDIEAVATALGVDMITLNNMDHTELVNMLTQQVN